MFVCLSLILIYMIRTKLSWICLESQKIGAGPPDASDTPWACRLWVCCAAQCCATLSPAPYPFPDPALHLQTWGTVMGTRTGVSRQLELQLEGDVCSLGCRKSKGLGGSSSSSRGIGVTHTLHLVSAHCWEQASGLEGTLRQKKNGGLVIVWVQGPFSDVSTASSVRHG